MSYSAVIKEYFIRILKVYPLLLHAPECMFCLSTKNTEQWRIEISTVSISLSPIITRSFSSHAFNDYLKSQHIHRWFPKSRSCHYILGTSGCSYFPTKANDVLLLYERIVEFRYFIKKQQKKLTKAQICSILITRKSICEEEQLIIDFWNFVGIKR